MFYVTIGQLMSKVCDGCSSKYVYGDQCVSQCPQAMYQFQGYKGGMACLTCSNKMNEFIKADRTGCQCFSGYILSTISGICIPNPATIVNTTSNITTTTTTTSTMPVVEGTVIPGAGTVTAPALTTTTTVPASTTTTIPSPSVVAGTTVVTTTTTAPIVVTGTTTTSATGTTTTPTSTPTPTSTTTTPTPILRVPTKSLSTLQSLDITNTSITTMGAKPNKTTNESILTINGNTPHISILDKPQTLNISNIPNIVTINKTISTTVSGLVPAVVPASPTANMAKLGSQNTTATTTTTTVISKSPILSIFSNDTLTALKQAPATKCQQNSTFNATTNKCQCDQFSMTYEATCFRCLPGSFKANDNCMACLAYCLKCVDGQSCLQCEPGFVYRLDINQCADPTTFDNNGGDNGDFSSDGNTAIPTTPTCSANMVLVNNVCECDGSSIPTSRTTCAKCPISTFKQGVSCSQCIDKCQTCTSATNCQKCLDSYTLNPQTNKCQPSSSIPAPASPPPTCTQNQTLINNKCQCNQRSVLYQNKCQQCLSFTYKDKQTDTCAPCGNIHPECQTCYNSTTCKTCQNNYQILDNGVCGCVPPFYMLDSGCTKCPDGFVYNEQGKTCLDPRLSNNNTTPTTNGNAANGIDGTPCGQSKVIVNNQCVCNNRSVMYLDTCVQCPQSTYLSSAVGCESCSNVHPFCKTCDSATVCKTCNNNYQVDSSHNCSCLPPYYMLQSGCIQCPPGFLYQPNQKTCIDPNLTPTTCTQNQTLQNNTCICNNRSILVNNQCLQCDKLSYKNLPTQCALCSQVILGCLTCLSASKCINCNVNYTLNGNGVCQCLAPYVVVNKECVPCVLPQIYSQAAKGCVNPPPIIFNQACKTNQEFVNGVCQCTSKTVNISGTCQPCPAAQYKNLGSCSPCMPNCLQCTSITDCQKCSNNHTFNAFDSMCQKTCQQNQILVNDACICDQISGRNAQGRCQICKEGTVKVDEECVRCSLNCAICTGPTFCNQCMVGYVLNMASSACCGLNQRYNTSNQKCQCNAGFRNISGSCGVCPQGLIYVQSSQTCITSTTPIPITPIIPINPNQKVCQQNQQLTNNICICINKTVRSTFLCQPCPPSSFYSSAGPSCIPCIANCIQCTDSQSCNRCQGNYTGRLCDSCADGYFIANNGVGVRRCVRQECGNGVVSGKQQCDDGNKINGDGCSSQCLVQNGYYCINTCTQVLMKTSELITSAGIIQQYQYMLPQSLTSTDSISLSVVNGTKPSQIKITRLSPDMTVLKAFFDYCGLLPQQNITVQVSAKSQSVSTRYTSEYDLINKAAIPRNTATKSLKEPEDRLS